MKLTETEIEDIKKTSEVYTEIVKTAKSKASNKLVDAILEEIAASGRTYTDREIIHRIFEGVRSTQWHNPRHMLFGYVEEILLRQGTANDQIDAVKAMTDYYVNKFHRN